MKTGWVAMTVASLALLLSSGCKDKVQTVGQWTEVNGHRLYFERYGKGHPHALVLLHGGGETIHSSYGPELDALAARYDVIAPEQVGQGHTPDVPGPLTYSGMMEDTAALLKQLDIERADVIGWSDGGNVGLMLTLRHPEMVRRLVVSGANLAPDGLNADELIDTRQQLEQAMLTAPDSFDAKLLRMWLDSPTPKELSPLLLKTISQPVLVMAGDHDAIRTEHTVEIYKALPKGQLLILPDTGHGTFDTRADWILPVLFAFLDAEE